LRISRHSASSSRASRVHSASPGLGRAAGFPSLLFRGRPAGRRRFDVPVAAVGEGRAGGPGAAQRGHRPGAGGQPPP
jgi:hypothetical protein